jgi:hypothetical protein
MSNFICRPVIDTIKLCYEHIGSSKDRILANVEGIDAEIIDR